MIGEETLNKLNNNNNNNINNNEDEVKNEEKESNTNTRSEKIEKMLSDVLHEIEKWKEELILERSKLDESKEIWKTLSDKLTTNALPNRIKLDVGGRVFSVSKDVLIADENNFFGAMFGGRFPLKAEDDGTYFINRDPTVFQHVLNYLNGVYPELHLMSEYDITLLKRDADYYQLSRLMECLSPKMESTILAADSQYIKTLSKWLNSPKFELLYRGSRDSFASNIVHQNCDNKGKLLFLMKSTDNNVFGGYTSVYNSRESNQIDDSAFLFTLINPHNIAATKFKVNPKSINYNQGTVYCHPSNSVCFGNSIASDLHVQQMNPVFQQNLFFQPLNPVNKNVNVLSLNVTFGSFLVFTDTTGKSSNIFTGRNNASLSEMEVFLVK